ncbi:MAG: hypothetical protein JSR85_01470 [Proteobacteria bacterium]|nr:hypothetical protein [Pseudomonadota bacterium]
MIYFFLILAFFLLPISAFAGGNDKEEDDDFEREQLSTLQLTLPPLSLGTLAKKPVIPKEDVIDLSDFTILDSVKNREMNSKRTVQSDVKTKDASWEHHIDSDKDIGNLRHLTYWYIEDETPLRVWVLLLKNARGVHPLADLMANEILAYTHFPSLNEAIELNDPDDFLRQALSKLSLSLLHLRQRIELTRPLDTDIENLSETQKRLEEKLNRVCEKIRKKEMAAAHLEGRTINRGESLKEFQESSKENAKSIREIINTLEKKKKDIQENIKNLEEKKKSIQERFSLCADQEHGLSETQKQELLFIREPGKLEAYMKEKFVKLQKNVTERHDSKSEEDQKIFAESLHSLAHCHFWGWGCNQSFTIAFEHFSAAASTEKHPRAYEAKGHMLAGGFGVKKSLQDAFKAYERYSLTDSNGLLLLAHSYRTGCGVKANPKQTLEQLKTAAEKHNPIALRALIRLDKSMTPFRNDQIESYGTSIDKQSKQKDHARFLTRIAQGDQDAYHSLGKYFLRETQAYYSAALCFAIGYLSIDSESTDTLYPIFYQEIIDEQLSDPDSSVKKRKVAEAFTEFLKQISCLVINENEKRFKEFYEVLEKLVKVKREFVKKAITLDSVGFGHMYDGACRGITECRRLLGYYYFFGWWREKSVKKAALFFEAVDSPLSSQSWEKKIAEIFEGRIESKKNQQKVDQTTDDECHYLPTTVKWSRLLGDIGYSTGDYKFGKIMVTFFPELSFKYFSRQGGQHPKATSELGKLYFTGRGTPDRKADRLKAFQEWFMASLKGCREAAFYAGACLEKGWGTKGTKEADRLRDAKEFLFKAKEEGYVISSKTLPEFRDIKLIKFPRKYDN